MNIVNFIIIAFTFISVFFGWTSYIESDRLLDLSHC